MTDRVTRPRLTDRLFPGWPWPLGTGDTYRLADLCQVGQWDLIQTELSRGAEGQGVVTCGSSWVPSLALAGSSWQAVRASPLQPPSVSVSGTRKGQKENHAFQRAPAREPPPRRVPEGRRGAEPTRGPDARAPRGTHRRTVLESRALADRPRPCGQSRPSPGGTAPLAAEIRRLPGPPGSSGWKAPEKCKIRYQSFPLLAMPVQTTLLPRRRLGAVAFLNIHFVMQIPHLRLPEQRGQSRRETWSGNRGSRRQHPRVG